MLLLLSHHHRFVFATSTTIVIMISSPTSLSMINRIEKEMADGRPFDSSDDEEGTL